MKRLSWFVTVAVLLCAGSALAQRDSREARQDLLLKLHRGQTPAVAASPSPLATNELIVDGGFEAGRAPSGRSGYSGLSGPWSWTTSDGGLNPIWDDDPGDSSPVCRAGMWCVYFAPFGPATNTISQQVAIPAGSKASLSFWVKIGTFETTTSRIYDTLSVKLLNASGGLLALLDAFSNLDETPSYSFVKKTYDVSAYAGQTVRFQFTSYNDSTGPTIFVLDDVSLIATTSGKCTANATTLCLISNRFQVTAQYDTYGSPDTFSNATATSFSDSTGFFTTVTAGEVDVVVKMVNFCSLNNTWSAYIGGTTDLGVKITITDTTRGGFNYATNVLANPWGLIRQVAFTCP